MVYELKDKYKDIEKDLKEDLWIMISFLRDSDNGFDKRTGDAFFKKYYVTEQEEIK